MSVSVHDVVSYFFELDKDGRGFSSMQLHKLCFIADALYQRATSQPLFVEYFTHAKRGPRYAELLPYHEKAYTIYEWPAGDISNLSFGQRNYLTEIFKAYSFIPGPQLAELTLKYPEYRNTLPRDVSKSL